MTRVPKIFISVRNKIFIGNNGFKVCVGTAMHMLLKDLHVRMPSFHLLSAFRLHAVPRKLAFDHPGEKSLGKM